MNFLTQINIRIDPDSDEILTFLAALRKVPKTVVAREFMLDGMSQKLLPSLLELYRVGKINVKKIAAIAHLTPKEVFQKIAEAGIEPPIPDRVEQYSESVGKLLVEAVKSGKVSLKQPPPVHPPELPFTREELEEED